ncbi:hypothetical protein D3C78_1051020 [compost metagenome]
MSLAFTRATSEPAEAVGTYSDTITGKPFRVPPVMVMVGNSGWPKALTIRLSDSAMVAVMMNTPEVGALFAAMKALNSAFRSVRTKSASVPLEGMPATPFRIEAGDTSETAALSGSMKSMSRR